MPVHQIPKEDIRRELKQMLHSHKCDLVEKLGQVKGELADKRVNLPVTDTTKLSEVEDAIAAKMAELDEIYDQFFAFVDNA